MALVAVPSHRLLLVVDGAALFPVPRLVLVQAGVPLPAGVRAVATVHRRLGSFIVQAQSSFSTTEPSFTSGLGGSSYATAGAHSNTRPRQAASGSALLASGIGLGHAAADADSNARLRQVTRRGSALLAYGFDGSSYPAASGDSSHHLGNIVSLATRGSVLFASGLGLRNFTTNALAGASGGSSSSSNHHLGWDDEATRHASKITKILRIRARLEVMFDQIPMASRSRVRELINELNELNPAAPVHHWVVPRLEQRLHQLLGEEVYEWIINMDVKLDHLSYVQTLLINCASNSIRGIRQFAAQVYHTVMHVDEEKGCLPVDHMLYDVTPALLKKAVLEYSEVVSSALDKRMVLLDRDPVVFLKELQKNANKLLSEKYYFLDYMRGPCEGHHKAVWNALDYLKEEIRPLRLSD